MQHLIERNKKKDATYSLFHSHGLLKLMQECCGGLYVQSVCATHVTSNMHPAAACRDSCESQFWSNLLGLLIGCHWVPSIHASTNVIPTCFVSCRWSLSIWSISDACACRVQASVRLLKVLRHIISKVNIFSDWCSVGTVLDCPPLEVLLFLASLSLWIFPGIPGVMFFLDFLGLLQVICLRFPARSFSMTRAHVLRCCNATFGRSR